MQNKQQTLRLNSLLFVKSQKLIKNVTSIKLHSITIVKDA